MAADLSVPLAPSKPRVIGRYALFGEIATGGMATVLFGRLVGTVGFSRTVAIKRLHPQYAKDPEFVAMFLDEARLASRIQHPNVVNTLDVVSMPNEVFLVMEYVQGESLSHLIRNAVSRGERLPVGHAVAIVAGMLHGLHAAHEAKSERREPLHIVHRDVSPQNVLVGTDGVARVLDFGVAKAAMRSGSTRHGQLKGKLTYMAPEQLGGAEVDRRTDLFAAGIVLWEALLGQRLFSGADPGEIVAKVLSAKIPEPRSINPQVSPELNAIVMKALERIPDKRYQTAKEFANALESAVPLPRATELGEWVERVAGDELGRRAELLAKIESASTNPEDMVPLSDPPGPLDGRSETGSGVQSASGSRPKLPPPPIPPRAGGDGTASRITMAATPAAREGFAVQSSPDERKRSRMPWIAGVLACLAGGALAFVVFSGSAENSWGGKVRHALGIAPEKAPVTVSDAPSASAKSAAPTETVEIEDLPKADPTDDLVVERVAPSDPSKATPTPPAGDNATHTVAKPAAAPSHATAAHCNPPFTVDEHGIKRLKPQCL